MLTFKESKGPDGWMLQAYSTVVREPVIRNTLMANLQNMYNKLDDDYRHNWKVDIARGGK